MLQIHLVPAFFLTDNYLQEKLENTQSLERELSFHVEFVRESHVKCFNFLSYLVGIQVPTYVRLSALMRLPCMCIFVGSLFLPCQKDHLEASASCIRAIFVIYEMVLLDSSDFSGSSGKL